MSLLPFLETITRVLNINGIPASQILVQHFTLWIGFLGAIFAARENKLLALTQESIFIKEAADNNLKTLKGHRSVGGLRASIYNAFPTEGVDVLANFMKDFELKYG